MLSRFTPDDRARLDKFCDHVTFAPGEVIVREGDHDRVMYIVTSGRAKLQRADLELGEVGPDEHFGELALVADRPRAATVIAITEIALAKIGQEGWRRVLADDPALGAKLLSSLVERLGAQLTEMTDSVGDLLRQRSLPRRARFDVSVDGAPRTVRTGTQVGELLPTTIEGARVVAALVDHTTVTLGTPVTAPAAIEPLLESHWEGERVIRDSAHLVVLEAANQAKIPMRIGASMGAATWLELDRARVPELQRAFADLVSRDVAIREEWWMLGEAREELERWGWKEASDLLSIWRESMVPLVTCGRVYALRNNALVPRAGFLRDYELRPIETGAVLLKRPAPRDVEHGFTPWADTMRDHDKWLSALGVTSVGAFNRACIDGDVSEIIRVSEGWHEKRLGRIADAIAARDDVRVVCIAGPSSSGKTTFIKRLRIQLQVVGIDSALVSLDDYYVDRVRTPRGPDGEYDYEVLQALDLELLREHITRMLDGETVRTARYDFVSGTSKKSGGKPISLGKGKVLMLEGIHGLNPELLDAVIASARLFRIFIQPMTSLPLDAMTRVSPSDLRLLRRIVRDRHSRGSAPGDNILRWPSVRRGERAHIFPFVDQADVVFDTSLVYEPSVLKIYAERYLLEVPRDHAAHATAVRLRTLIDRFVAIHAAHVPPISMLREFIGESGFEY